MSSHTLSYIGATPIPEGSEEIRGFLCVRDEELRLPSVLDHHRRLGVDRFFVIDNGSIDGSRDYLLTRDDVHLFETSESFSAARAGRAWVEALLDRYGEARWCLNFDADELLVFPRCEQVGIRALTGYLDATGAGALFAVLLDMYSDRAIRDTHHVRGRPFLETCAFFDPRGYRTLPADSFPKLELRGGVRERVFWGDRQPDFHPPTLSKVPLVKWRRGFRFLSATHFMSPTALADVTAVLLHFKFFSDAIGKAAIKRDRGEHFAASREYRIYAETFAHNPDLSLMHADSQRYRDSLQLVRLKLMRMPPAFGRYLSETLGRSE